MVDPERDDAFGRLLRAYRQTRGLTQEALAECTGLGTRTVQELERGANRPHRETLARLVDGLQLAGEERHFFEQAARPIPRRHRGSSAPPSRQDPLPSSDSRDYVSNLPLSLTSFIGRMQEMREITQLMAHNRLVTMIGAGGLREDSLSRGGRIQGCRQLSRWRLAH